MTHSDSTADAQRDAERRQRDAQRARERMQRAAQLAPERSSQRNGRERRTVAAY